MPTRVAVIACDSAPLASHARMVMILWGDTPAGEAQLYFPEFNAAEIITQAESMASSSYLSPLFPFG